MKYDPNAIEPKWQDAWFENKVFRTPTDPKAWEGKDKYYILDMFPYPSGAGLHVGHPEGYTATDVMARLKRMQGKNVLHPMGWDAFGLPAERAAMREGRHPADITKRNINNFRRQIQRLGFSYDWDREISTTDEGYYRWTQWIFLKLYKKGLAYLADVPVNWCPALGTVLANEEVKDGKYVETDDPVEPRLMKQWMLKITAYGDRLLKDLKLVDWPESVKEMQRNWIGKSTGAEVRFEIAGIQREFIVFTTRPDTLFGATYCVLAPEHGLVAEITADSEREAVETYVQAAGAKSDLDRTDLAKEKTGVFTGAFAINPVNGIKIPIWVADYVLMGYGTGAIMAVPGHDERDHEFAKAFELPIIQVISGGNRSVQDEAYTGDGAAVNSDFINGLKTKEAIAKMCQWLEAKGKGKAKTQYRLRDWLFSRQRYWGEPFPLVHLEDGTVVPLPEEFLPVSLPTIDAYRPTDDGEPPLARAPDDWLMVTLPDGRKGRMECNTMPQWAGSCWYYLRYLDARNQDAPWSQEAEKYWMPVDLYVGGVEHAVLHLLYARFWHKVLYDCGLVHTKEPFQRLINQGMILAYSYQDASGKYYTPEEVEEQSKGNWTVKASGKPVKTQIEKMSKSRYNVVNPDDVVAQHGADALRLYELFMGPLEATKPWQMSGIDGISRFLKRVWRLVVNESDNSLNPKLVDGDAERDSELNKALHKTCKKVLEDTEGMRFNTAIAQMMVFVNMATTADSLPRETIKIFLRLIAPYAPHIAEELWERLGEARYISMAPVPSWDEALVVEDLITIVIQINGKKRDNIKVPKDASNEDIEKAALATKASQKFMDGKSPKRVIVVPERLVNIVI